MLCAIRSRIPVPTCLAVRLLPLLAALFCAVPAIARPQEYPLQGLDSATWSVVDRDGNILDLVKDNNPDTFTTQQGVGDSRPAALFIDLGVSTAVDRVFITGPSQKFLTARNRNELPLGLLKVFLGNTPETATQVAEAMIPHDAGNPVDAAIDLRFQPAIGRYLRLELQTAVNWQAYWTGWPDTTTAPKDLGWKVAELEVHGFPGVAVLPRGDAVIVPSGAALPLQMAASDLSYYLGKLSGSPVPIISAAEAAAYGGTLFEVEDLKPLAGSWAAMMENRQAGRLPAGTSVRLEDGRVVFSGWPYRNLLRSVWAFLLAQGIRFPYPDAHGDYIPAKGQIDLSVLPLNDSSLPEVVYANWDVSGLNPWPSWVTQTWQSGYLNVLRNGWNSSWNVPMVLGGSEIPAKPQTDTVLSGDYTEGFAGYPHNFNNVIPDRVLTLHPNWWGYSESAGTRVAPGGAGAVSFDWTNPELISWVADKLAAVERYQPLSPLQIPHSRWASQLLPLDAARFDQSEASAALNLPVTANPLPWVRIYPNSQSGAYYNFVNEAARQAKAKNPDVRVGALAYADVFLPPPNIAKLEDNVIIEVCQYGSPNLPLDATPNAAFKAVLKTWSQKAHRLANYDYTLLHTDYWQRDPQMPVAAIAGIVDRAKYLHNLGALNGGSQATPESFPYNPWNFYAYGRIRQDLGLSSSAIAAEFFQAYFREAAAPMLQYYRVMEDWQVRNEVDLHLRGYCYGITPASFPLGILSQMGRHLAEAENLATYWVVKNRVSSMREGYDWLISQRGLAAVDLYATSHYQQLGLNQQPVELHLQDAQKPDQGPWGNYAQIKQSAGAWQWEFLSQGLLYLPVYFTRGGIYKVEFKVAIPDWSTLKIANFDAFLGPRRMQTPILLSKLPVLVSAEVIVGSDFGVQDFAVRTGAQQGVVISEVKVTYLRSVSPAAPLNLRVQAVAN